MVHSTEEARTPKAADAELSKGSKVTLARDLEVGGKVIPSGTSAKITYVHPNGLLVRATTSDGVKISRGVAAFKGVEDNNENAQSKSKSSNGSGDSVLAGVDRESKLQGDSANNAVAGASGNERSGRESFHQSAGSGTIGEPGPERPQESVAAQSQAHISEIENPAQLHSTNFS